MSFLLQGLLGTPGLSNRSGWMQWFAQYLADGTVVGNKPSGFGALYASCICRIKFKSGSLNFVPTFIAVAVIVKRDAL